MSMMVVTETQLLLPRGSVASTAEVKAHYNDAVQSKFLIIHLWAALTTLVISRIPTRCCVMGRY